MLKMKVKGADNALAKTKTKAHRPHYSGKTSWIDPILHVQLKEAETEKIKLKNSLNEVNSVRTPRITTTILTYALCTGSYSTKDNRQQRETEGPPFQINSHISLTNLRWTPKQTSSKSLQRK